jgi:hypothetical protein
MSNPTIVRDICGTKQGFVKHKTLRENKCAPCRAAYSASPRRMNVTELVAEIEHMLSLHQGAAYILRAIEYTGREKQLRDRLYDNGRLDLYEQVITPEYLAAA